MFDMDCPECGGYVKFFVDVHNIYRSMENLNNGGSFSIGPEKVEVICNDCGWKTTADKVDLAGTFIGGG